jgi:uncharacterized BrkB/YihY/UPF0761 family membrane protein
MESDTQGARAAPVASTVILSDPGTVQLMRTVASDTIGALGAQPVLLLIVILNMIFIGSGAYFFVQLEHFRHSERLQIISLLAQCEIPRKGTP